MKDINVIEKLKEEAKLLKEAQKSGTSIEEIAMKIEEEKKAKEEKRKTDLNELLKERIAEEAQIILNFLHQPGVIPDKDYVFFSVFDKYKKIFAKSKLQIVIASNLTELEDKIQSLIKENSKSKIFIHTLENKIINKLKKMNEDFADIYNSGRIGTVKKEENDNDKAKILKSRDSNDLPITYYKIETFWDKNYNYPTGTYYTYLEIPVYNNIKFIRLIEIL